MAITYRMNTEADEPALVDLWTRHSDWGSITAEQWEQKFLRTPLGAASFMLATEDSTNEIVAQIAYMPTPVMVRGQEISGYRPYAVIVNENFRSKAGFLRLQQMVVSMYLKAADSLADRGVDLLYMLPDPRWSRILRLMPAFQSTTFPLWSRPLTALPTAPLPAGYAVAPLAPDDARIDGLAALAADLYVCMVARDTRMLPWKITQAAYQLFGVSHRGELVGLFTCIKRRKDNQWLIEDVLSADMGDTLHATLQAACLVIEEQNAALPDDERPAYRKMAVLSTLPMEPLLRELGFSRDKYDFLLVVHTLNKALGKDQVSPEQWYVSAND
ncbi:hypothetical protein GCM10027048_41520 [Hymenobacter coalescens]